MNVRRFLTSLERQLRAVKILALTVIISFLILTGGAQALFSPNLTGNAYLSALNSLTDTLHQQSLNQQYYLNWQKSLTPYLVLRSSLSYSNFGSSQNIGINSWRKDFSPSAELFWKHPLFSLDGAVQRRETSSNDLTSHLVTDFLTTSFRSRLTNYPYLNAQFQQSNIYNKPDRSERDTVINH